MRVAVKLVMVMVMILAAVRLVEGVLTIQRETDRLRADIERDAKLMDRVLQGFVSEVWREQGPARALALLASVNVVNHPVELAWVPIEGDDGLLAELDDQAIEQLAEGRSVMIGHPERAGQRKHRVYTPLNVAGTGGVIRTTEALDERSRYLKRSMLRELAAGGLVVLFGGTLIVAWGFVSIGKPLGRLEQRIDEIGQGNLTNRLHVRGRDELASLARGINAMCERLALSHQREREASEQRIAAIEQMRHADRLTTIGRLASGIAHELGTPLNVVIGRAEMIAAGRAEAAQVHEYARTIESQATRMAAIIRHLLDFARQRQPHRTPTAVMGVVRQTVDLVASLGYKGHVRIDAESDADALKPQMDAGQIQQVLINLIHNALQAMPEGGEATVGVRSVHADPPAGSHLQSGRFIRIDVTDTGTGIAPEHRPALFDPFFTTKDVGQGTGLGLSIAHGIVSEHGGWINVTSEVGQGSCFSVYLPDSEAT